MVYLFGNTGAGKSTLINYLLGTLQPGDSLAVARIDTGSFSEKDIVAKVTGRLRGPRRQRAIESVRIDSLS